jgi:hypothetical protein
MDTLELIIQPTIEALLAEDYIDPEDETALLFEQGVRSQPLECDAGDQFDVRNGFEALPVDKAPLYVECDEEYGPRPPDAVERNGLWIEPEDFFKLSSGRYIYKGHRVFKPVCIANLVLERRRTRKSLLSEQRTEEEIEYFPADPIWPGEEFEISDDGEVVLAFPPCVLVDPDGSFATLEIGSILPAGKYVYAEEEIIERREETGAPDEKCFGMPTKAMTDFLRILTEVFSPHQFKYENERFFCLLGSEWIDIFEFTGRQPDENKGEWPSFYSLGSGDDARDKKYIDYQIMKDTIETVRDKFFAPQQIKLEATRIPTFSEFLEL